MNPFWVVESTSQDPIKFGVQKKVWKIDECYRWTAILIKIKICSLIFCKVILVEKVNFLFVYLSSGNIALDWMLSVHFDVWMYVNPIK